MFGLPEDVSRHVRSFMCPIRFDWRTCKVHEADLIQGENYDRMLQAYYHGFGARELEEVYEWTLFGMRYVLGIQWLNHLTPPLFPPREEDYRVNYANWYEHRIQWLSQ